MMIYIHITKFVLINHLEKDHSMIETRRLKYVVIVYHFITMKKHKILMKEDAGWGRSASFAGKSSDSVHWFSCEGCFKGSPVIKCTYVACLKFSDGSSLPFMIGLYWWLTGRKKRIQNHAKYLRWNFLLN